MRLTLVLLIQLFNHTCFRGSKVLLTLFALELGASPVTVGLLFSMYSLLPAFMSVYAGRLSDRVGFRAPMLVGSIGMLLGMLVPFLAPSLAWLFVSAILTGSCYIFYTVSVQNLIGSLGGSAERTRNYSLYSVCVGFTALFGPVLAGFSIEHLGGPRTYLLMAGLCVVPITTLLLAGHLLPSVTGTAGAGGRRGALDLLREVGLRRMLIIAGVVEAGNELGNFLLPIYGHSIGLTPSQIGLVMGGLAAALLVVRTLLPGLVRRLGEEQVLAGSMLVAASACVLFPFADSFYLVVAGAFLMGLGMGCGAPLSMVLVFNRSPAGRSGEAMGFRQTVNKGTEVVVPLFFGSVSTAFGMLPVFWLVALLLVAGGWLMQSEVRRGSAE